MSGGTIFTPTPEQKEIAGVAILTCIAASYGKPEGLNSDALLKNRITGELNQ